MRRVKGQARSGDDNHAVGAVATRAGTDDDTETGGLPVSWNKGELTGKLVELRHWRRCSATCARWRPRESRLPGFSRQGVLIRRLLAGKESLLVCPGKQAVSGVDG